ncbi:polyphosphate kinase [Yersinia similis]|uniref:Polyphosphate kinase n=2 Tax=Yersinia similis TaxID=367190 RepID=A0ABN4CPP2_9GAMM|nr:hypothetical protein [Yersinia similis]AHK20343.1 polyphosphate kinase [Yersinia similis]CFQ60424.1 Uncharacterised protein [Yersinia similis]
MLNKNNDWNIDTSAGVPILVYKNCSVIESEQAEYILQLINNEVEMAVELLSLREQYKSQSNELTAMTAAAQALRDEMYKCDAKLDALKSLPRHIFSVLVNELRDVPAVGCKRELIVGVLNRHGVSAEMCEPPATE